ncbi:MAG: hypothetical protein AAGK93_01870 [Pseudomonadota bacterium]
MTTDERLQIAKMRLEEAYLLIEKAPAAHESLTGLSELVSLAVDSVDEVRANVHRKELAERYD